MKRPYFEYTAKLAQATSDADQRAMFGGQAPPAPIASEATPLAAEGAPPIKPPVEPPAPPMGAEPLGGAAMTGAGARAIVRKMYAPPPRGPVLPRVYRVLDYLTVGVLWVILGVGAGAVGVTTSFRMTLFGLLLLWPLCRFGIWYSDTQKKIKDLERAVEVHESRERYELEPEIERLKEQLRECG